MKRYYLYLHFVAWQFCFTQNQKISQATSFDCKQTYIAWGEKQKYWSRIELVEMEKKHENFKHLSKCKLGKSLTKWIDSINWFSKWSLSLALNFWTYSKSPKRNRTISIHLIDFDLIDGSMDIFIYTILISKEKWKSQTRENKNNWIKVEHEIISIMFGLLEINVCVCVCVGVLDAFCVEIQNLLILFNFNDILLNNTIRTNETMDLNWTTTPTGFRFPPRLFWFQNGIISTPFGPFYSLLFINVVTCVPTAMILGCNVALYKWSIPLFFEKKGKLIWFPSFVQIISFFFFFF